MSDFENVADIAFDAGGPFAEPAAKGTIEAIKATPGGQKPPKIILVGRELVLAPLIKGFETYVRVEDAPDFIKDGFDYTQARTRRDSSLVKTASLARSGKANACISFSDTPCVTAIFTGYLGRIDGISLPPTASIWPGKKRVVFLDSGGVVNCKPEDLVQFARLGSILSQTALGVPKPRVGLLSVGEEKSKGNDLVQPTFPLLELTEDINFCGNAEGYDMLLGDFDVIVTDGFAGNVGLKAAESVLKLVKLITKEHPIEAALAYFFLRILKKRLDAAQHGGAVILGTKVLGMIGHGKSNALACQQSILAMHNYLTSGVDKVIAETIPTLAIPKIEV